MLRLTICLLVAKTAFAAHAFPVETGSYGPVGPDTNLVFNFEQIRRDQPPQIEMREENIHKYMNRPRTTPRPIEDGDMTRMRPEHPIPYTADQWTALQTAPKYDGPVSNWKNVPAPPSFPHWDSLATKPTYNYESPAPQNPIVVESEPESVQWHEPEIQSRAMPNYVSSTAAPVTYSTTVRAPMTRRSPWHARGRGQHRFNWDDVTTTTSAPISSSAAPGRTPPPPVPTLSPWYDGF